MSNNKYKSIDSNQSGISDQIDFSINERNIMEDYEGNAGTSGASNFNANILFALPQNVDIFRDIIPVFHKIEDSPIKESILTLLLAFQNIILDITSANDFSGYLPPLQLKQDDDGDMHIEWIFKDFRIGFLIESKTHELSWYLVSNSNLNDHSESGVTSIKDCESLLRQLIPFVLSLV